MSGFSGGKDPFDDPFFTRLSGSMFGAAAAHDPLRASGLKGPVIQELDSDSLQLMKDNDDTTGEGESGDKYHENAWANRNPYVEHPDDDHNQNRSKSTSKDTSYGTDHGKAGGNPVRTSGVSYQRVTYGGINGPYYTASKTRRTGNDGMVLEESQQADKTTGEATHRISRGIHDQGHSVTRKLDSDGMVDTTETLHNLDEDELASFEQTWKGKDQRLLPGGNDGFNLHANSGGTGALPFGQNSGREVGSLGRDAQARSTGGRPKKVVNVPIE